MTSVSYKKAEANEEVPYDAEPTLNNFILEVVWMLKVIFTSFNIFLWQF